MDFERIKEKLWKRTDIDPITECWLWNGSRTKKGLGHGQITVDSVSYLTHRLSAVIHLDYDLWDAYKQVLHKTFCPNKNCWNPEHLYLGTPSDNSNDSVTTGTHKESSKTHCPKGHPYSTENTGYSAGRRYCKLCKIIQGRIDRSMQKIRMDHLP